MREPLECEVSLEGQRAGTEYREIPDPARNLAAAIIRRAIKDLHKGRPCNRNGGPCGRGAYSGVHVCEQAAIEFLTGDLCRDLLLALDLDPEAVLEALALG
jgi:hypothetical protein